MVMFDHAVKIAWLEGMETTGIHQGPAWIAQALQQTRLKMNESGARAEGAVFFSVLAAAKYWWERPRPDHIINRPFLVWFERKGLAKPLFVAHITEEDWRSPGDIRK